jgi:hypothetical protein
MEKGRTGNIAAFSMRHPLLRKNDVECMLSRSKDRSSTSATV